MLAGSVDLCAQRVAQTERSGVQRLCEFFQIDLSLHPN